MRDEGHDGGHVGEQGGEWMVAMRCHIGANGGGAVCDKIEGHEGPRVPREPHVPIAGPVLYRRPRGVCPCGAPRKEHDGGTGGCAATKCERYGKRVRA